MVDFATAFENQSVLISSSRRRLQKLFEIVNRPQDLSFLQWNQLLAMGLDFRPGLVLELGRGYGNSTTVFTEAVNLNNCGRVVSIGYDSEHTWERVTAPKLRAECNSLWFSRLTVLHQDILQTDFGVLLESFSRVLLFWDAHGSNLARFILATLMPLLAKRDNVVIVHDISDVNFNPSEPSQEDSLSGLTTVANFTSPFDELISIYDFLSSNSLAFDSPEASTARRMRLGNVADDLQENARGGHWLYFVVH